MLRILLGFRFLAPVAAVDLVAAVFGFYRMSGLLPGGPPWFTMGVFTMVTFKRALRSRHSQHSKPPHRDLDTAP
jgi:hypothetical protein